MDFKKNQEKKQEIIKALVGQNSEMISGTNNNDSAFNIYEQTLTGFCCYCHFHSFTELL